MTLSAGTRPTQSVGVVERVTIDASVWLAALWAHEPGHAAAARVLAEVDRQHIRVRLGLRGADACYVATSRLEQTTLITLDLEVIERARVLIEVQSPADWLER